jgi:hypothetical protein
MDDMKSYVEPEARAIASGKDRLEQLNKEDVEDIGNTEDLN